MSLRLHESGITQDNDDREASPESQVAHAVIASRTTWVSIWVNLLLTLTQITAGVLARSQGLISDGIHSLSGLAWTYRGQFN